MDSVFSLPRLERLTVPQVVGNFFSKLAPLLLVPRTSRELLEAFAGIDVKAERIAELLRANQACEFLFMRNVQALSKREQVPSLESAVVLFGMQNSRNWICAVQLHRRIRGAFPDFDGEGKLISRPAELVKYAVRAEDPFTNQKDGYADTAFLAGLHFDILAFAAGRLIGDDQARLKIFLSFLDSLFSQGFERFKRGSELAKANPKFSARKYLFSACLLADLGKATLALLEPGYLKFDEDAEKAPRLVRMEAEVRKYGTSHAVLSVSMVRFVNLVREIELVVQFHHEADSLKGNPSMQELAGVISRASASA